jgi:hypothetical protein
MDTWLAVSEVGFDQSYDHYHHVIKNIIQGLDGEANGQNSSEILSNDAIWGMFFLGNKFFLGKSYGSSTKGIYGYINEKYFKNIALLNIS